MSVGAITLADVAARTDVLVVSCSRCDRIGQWLFERQRAGESRPTNAGPGGKLTAEEYAITIKAVLSRR